MNTPEISIITTIYNGETIIEELVEKIKENTLKVSNSFEIILVEDCSPDNSWKKIEEVAKKHPEVKGIKLSRNFGQQLAMTTGMRYAKGNIVIIMDGDLQNPPEAIPSLITKVKEGYDVVFTTSKTRNNFKDELTSKIFWIIKRNV